MLPEKVNATSAQQVRVLQDNPTEFKFVLNNSDALTHLTQFSSPLKDVSKDRGMATLHDHCTMYEIKTGLKMTMQRKSEQLFSVYQPLHQATANQPLTERLSDVRDSAI